MTVEFNSDVLIVMRVKPRQRKEEIKPIKRIRRRDAPQQTM
jgi:hypothetical protein